MTGTVLCVRHSSLHQLDTDIEAASGSCMMIPILGGGWNNSLAGIFRRNSLHFSSMLKG